MLETILQALTKKKRAESTCMNHRNERKVCEISALVELTRRGTSPKLVTDATTLDFFGLLVLLRRGGAGED